jgi:hypothetical protein
MATAHNLRQRRARVLREIAHYAAALAANTDPATPHQRTAHTRAARCLAARAKLLAETQWPERIYP